MNIHEVLTNGIRKLKEANIETPVVEAGVILCHVLKCNKTYLFAHDDQLVGSGDFNTYMNYINSRIKGKPLQYITGHQEFMSLDFIVTPDVLIPRQDTEILVETVIDYFNNKNPIAHSPLPIASILDLGTGSGCIAVSLAHYIEGCRIVAVDISEGALEIARLNAAGTGTYNKIELLKSNMFERIKESKSEYKFDVIVSNPPYIPASHIEGLQIEVREYEPVTALDGGTDGFDFYRAIINEAHEFLKPDGLLAFEVGYDQASEVSNLMSEKYCDIKTYKDLSGIERVVAGKLKD